MRRRALALTLLLAALCVLGFVLRTTNAPTVFVGDAVVFAENDPYYHMRRVFQILAAYPHVPSFDPWIDFPNGAPVVFAPLFDLGIATLAKVAGFAAADRIQVETLAAFVPPILGAMICLPVFWVAVQTTTLGAAALAAVLATLIPAHIWYSRLGFVDHHVAVTLVEVTMLALVLRALGVGRVGRDDSSRATSLLWTGLATLALAAGMLLWNGYLLLVALLDLCLLALFAVAARTRRREIARLACVIHLGAALLVLPFVPQIVRDTGAAVSTITLSYLHVGVLAVVAAASGLAAWVSARERSARTIVALAGGTVVLVLAVLLVERQIVAGVGRWLFADDPFMSSVQESVSIVLTSDGRLDLDGAQVWMTRFFLVEPLLLGWLAYRVVRERFADEGRTVVLVWASVLFCLTLGQRRFGEVAAPSLAIVVADSLIELARAERARLGARGVARRTATVAVTAVAALLIVIAFAPYYRGFLVMPGRLTALLRAPVVPGSHDAFSAADRAQQDASDDVDLHRELTRFAALRKSAAESSGAIDAPSAVMSLWPLGHKLLYVAGTPVTATPFGSYVGGSGFADGIEFFLARDERQALDVLSRRGSRWVVVDDDLGTIGAAIVGRGENPRAYYAKEEQGDGIRYSFQAPFVQTLYFRLTKLAGSGAKLTRADGTQEAVPALEHLRLVLDSVSDDESGHAKAYEVVQGAPLLVHAAPGAAIEARYAYRSAVGRERVYEASVVADARGEARLILPYSSERADLGQTSSWTVSSAGREQALHVAESDVRDGRELSLAIE